MTVNFDNEYEKEPLSEVFDFDYEETARLVVHKILEQESCPYEAQVEILFVSEDGIQNMNREHRNIDRVTDVLSFPMVEFAKPSDYTILESGSDDFYFDPDSGELQLGDIVLCIPKIKEQAKEYGHSEKREYAFLIAHSMLHLLGYDHMTKEEAADMERRQEHALEGLGITREGEHK